MKSKLKASDIINLCTSLGIMIESGLTIPNALLLIIKSSNNKRLKKILDCTINSIYQGNTFSHSINNSEKLFSVMEIGLIKIGEQSGELPFILKSLGKKIADQEKVKKKIQGIMFYPVIVLVTTFILVTLMLIFILPSFIKLFNSSKVKLPLLTRVLIFVKDFISNYWWLILILLFSFIVFCKFYLKKTKGKILYAKVKLTFPIFKSIYRDYLVINFLQNLSLILESGIPIFNGMDLLISAQEDPLFKSYLLSTKEALRRGEKLSTALGKGRYINSTIITMISLGEESGNLPNLARKGAEYLDEEFNSNISKLLVLLEPMLIFFLGFVIGTVILGIYLPMFDIISLAS